MGSTICRIFKKLINYVKKCFNCKCNNNKKELELPYKLKKDEIEFSVPNIDTKVIERKISDYVEEDYIQKDENKIDENKEDKENKKARK